MKLSMIIPVYNASQYLDRCLEAVYRSKYDSFEVIVVDDASRDSSVEIAKKYPCTLVRFDENAGQGKAKNAGVEKASGEILVFIDPDVIVKEDTLSVIADTFGKNPELSALTGILSKEHPNRDFFSQYKNLYMNYVFSELPEQIDFLYGSIMAIKKAKFPCFEEMRMQCDDTEIGQRLNRIEGSLVIERSLEVVHMKRYSFLSFVKNDFSVPFYWAGIFLRHKGLEGFLRKKRFAHARGSQILSLLIAPLLLFFLLMTVFSAANGAIAAVLFAIFLLLNFKFFAFLKKERGFLFAVKAAAVTYLDMWIMGIGILSGFIAFFFRGKKS